MPVFTIVSLGPNRITDSILEKPVHDKSVMNDEADHSFHWDEDDSLFSAKSKKQLLPLVLVITE